MNPKPGWKSTEFWLTLLTNIAAVVATVAETLPPEKAAFVMAVVNAIYAISRGMTKKQ